MSDHNVSMNRIHYTIIHKYWMALDVKTLLWEKIEKINNHSEIILYVFTVCLFHFWNIIYFIYHLYIFLIFI
uniref:Uncharacterized protein n=1 Tax=Octopus bimaculoides TaxID=37653 RepID=A0A0L8GYD9_OCTBM